MYLLTYGNVRMNAAQPMEEKIIKKAINLWVEYIKK